MRRAKLLVLVVAVAALVLSAGTAQAQEWIQHPMTDAWWWCEYYGSEYWCNVQNVETGEWGWVRAVPGWQYGSLGG